MSLKIVNTIPGDVATPIKPDSGLEFSLKSETSLVSLGAVDIDVAFSSLVYTGELPEDSQLPASVSLRTLERFVPEISSSARVIENGVKLTRSFDASSSEKCVYEVRAPVRSQGAVVGYAKIVKSTWAPLAAWWSAYAGTRAPYIGLIHGHRNSGVFAFLKTGGVVLAGPYLGPGLGRIESFYPLDWESLADGEHIELWLKVDPVGLPSPYTPADVPVVEIWAKLPSDQTQQKLATVALSVLQNFVDPTSGGQNSRSPDEDGVFLFGNVGEPGESVVYTDWAFYPDYRKAVLAGMVQPDHSLRPLPDSPITYAASAGLSPDRTFPQWWQPAGSAEKSAKLFYPLANISPSYLRIARDGVEMPSFERSEPRLGTVAEEGFVVEAVMAAEPATDLQPCFGAGLAIEDGSRRYELLMTQDATASRKVGLVRSYADIIDLTSGYHLSSTEVDWRTQKLFRLFVDPLRNRAGLFVDNVRVLDIPDLATAEFPTAIQRRIQFGHVFDAKIPGELRIASLMFQQGYKAWESEDQTLPTASPYLFSDHSAVAASTIDSSGLTIDKVLRTAGSCAYYEKLGRFGEHLGAVLDFRCRVLTFVSQNGTRAGAKTDTGVGLRVTLGNKVLHLGLYDCGVHGRKIAILPGSGTLDDILNQTDLGARFSAGWDWFSAEDVRVVLRGHRSIDIILGAKTNSPSISIPWRSEMEGFDLPLDNSTSAVAFGHFEDETASTSVWEYLRWSSSHGYDVELSQQFPEGMQGYHFGGRALVRIEAEEEG